MKKMSTVKKHLEAARAKRLETLAKKDDFILRDLSVEQEETLLESILQMPVEKQNLLLFRHYYHHSFEEIDELLSLEHAKGEYMNTILVLSEQLGLEGDMISEESLNRVCKSTAEKINEKLFEDLEYFYEMEQKGKTVLHQAIKINSWGKRVAVFFLCVLVSASVLFGANAYAQGKLVKWIVNHFEKYSSFQISEEDAIDKKNLDIEIGFVPDRFVLADEFLNESEDLYYYENPTDILAIVFVYQKISGGLNTENAKIETFTLDQNEVITWENKGVNFFVLSKNGVGIQILGDITKEEFLKIYEGIVIQHK